MWGLIAIVVIVYLISRSPKPSDESYDVRAPWMPLEGLELEVIK